MKTVLRELRRRFGRKAGALTSEDCWSAYERKDYAMALAGFSRLADQGDAENGRDAGEREVNCVPSHQFSLGRKNSSSATSCADVQLEHY